MPQPETHPEPTTTAGSAPAAARQSGSPLVRWWSAQAEVALAAGRPTVGSALPVRLALGAAAWVLIVATLGSLLALVGWWVLPMRILVALIAAIAAVNIGRKMPHHPIPTRPAWALTAVVLALTICTGATHAEQLIPRRDAASYAQSTVYLANTGERMIRPSAADTLGPTALSLPGVTLESPAFYSVGSPNEPVVQPQFMAGPSVIYSLPYSLGGFSAMFWAPAVLAGLALFLFGLMVALLVGPWWGVLAAALAGVSFPWLHTARATFSEPLATAIMLAGLLLLVLAASPTRRVASARTASWWAGIFLAGTLIARADALREIMLLVPLLALGAVREQRWAPGAIRGLRLGTLAFSALGLATSWRYLGSIVGSLLPLVAMLLVMVAICWAWTRHYRGTEPLLRASWWPTAAAGLVLLVGVFLATRPLWQVVRQNPKDPGSIYVGRMQQALGLPVDGARTYAEQSVTWVSWWIGPVALVLALLALAALVGVLVRSLSRPGALPWASGPLLVAAGTTALTLYRPGITPDHPWAERRLVLIILAVIALAIAAVAWIGRRLAQRSPALAGLVSLGLVAAVAMPTWLATAPHARERIEEGSPAMVKSLCARLKPADVVLMVDDQAANELPQVVRGQCGVAAMSLTRELSEHHLKAAQTIDRLNALAQEQGRTLVLLARNGRESLDRVHARSVTEALAVTQTVEQQQLVQRPEGTNSQVIAVWMGTPAAN